MASEGSAKKRNLKSKAIGIVFFVVAVFLVAGISSIIVEKYLFPRLAASEPFRNWQIFKEAMENVTVINRTEQVTVSESQNISSYVQKSGPAVVEVFFRNKGSKNISLKGHMASGIIVSADGLVASHGSAFSGGEDIEYKVFVQDGKSYEAYLVLNDPFSGIVLLKMQNAENLPVAEFIAPEDIKAGMKIAAISRSGFNSEIVLKTGVTSEWSKAFSLAGPLASSEKLQGVLLTDFSPSNNESVGSMSGAAAVDQNGNLIGVLGEKNNGGISQVFIVPVNHLRHVVDQYLNKGRIERAFLGVYYQSLSRETAFLSGIASEKGALIFSYSGQQGLSVLAGSPAEKSGIRMGDVILSVNGSEINPDQNLAYLISQCKPGDAVKLHILRGGEEMDVVVTLQ